MILSPLATTTAPSAIAIAIVAISAFALLSGEESVGRVKGYYDHECEKYYALYVHRVNA